MYKHMQCPFCGYKDAKIGWRFSNRDYTGPRRYWVQCNCCECRGPEGRTKDEAIAAWNKRRDAVSPDPETK